MSRGAVLREMREHTLLPSLPLRRVLGWAEGDLENNKGEQCGGARE